MVKKISSFAVAVALATAVVSCNDSGTAGMSSEDSARMADSAKMAQEKMAPKEEEGVMVGGAKMVPSKNIVENALGSSDHTTLVAAVKQAGLVETLSGAGPFTVFAPTNEAFAKVPADALASLMKDENKSKLGDILKYHVVPGKLTAADLKDGQELTTVEGKKLKVTVKDGKVMVNGANVTIADVISSNGVTHVIDAVLMPGK